MDGHDAAADAAVAFINSNVQVLRSHFWITSWYTVFLELLARLSKEICGAASRGARADDCDTKNRQCIVGRALFG